jgi:hypothetical protein
MSSLRFCHTPHEAIFILQSLLFVACRQALASVFSEHWRAGDGELGTLPGLDAAFMTCQDYLEELRTIAQPRVHAVACKCLLQHLACCIAARMLCSAHPYNAAWQKGVAIEMSRLQTFAQGQLRGGETGIKSYLAMLSTLRTLLCAPDAFSIVISYHSVRPWHSS